MTIQLQVNDRREIEKVIKVIQQITGKEPIVNVRDLEKTKWQN